MQVIADNSFKYKREKYFVILCKNKRIANTICKNIGEFTERPWEAPTPELIKKGIIWQYN